MLNRQIEEFNRTRPADMGIAPIRQRVARVEHVVGKDAVRCLDEKSAHVVTLNRQEDGTFKGALKTEYHQLPRPEGHSWGHVLLDLTLPEGLTD